MLFPSSGALAGLFHPNHRPPEPPPRDAAFSSDQARSRALHVPGQSVHWAKGGGWEFRRWKGGKLQTPYSRPRASGLSFWGENCWEAQGTTE